MRKSARHKHPHHGIADCASPASRNRLPSTRTESIPPEARPRRQPRAGPGPAARRSIFGSRAAAIIIGSDQTPARAASAASAQSFSPDFVHLPQRFFAGRTIDARKQASKDRELHTYLWNILSFKLQ